jgi:membrane-associated phospholipid phosphatase
VVVIGGWDDDISDWARENTPLFGSTENALDASDTLRTLSNVSMITTALAAPNQPGPWGSRVGRWAIEAVGVVTATQTSTVLKGITDRERPDGEDTESLPSGHATRAFAYVANSRRNLDLMPMSNTARNAFKSGFTALAAGTAWARVEGGKHYPTDVLVGAALGNFVAILMHDAFLGRDPRVRVHAEIHEDGGSIRVHVRF